MRIIPVTVADLAEYRALPIDLDYDDYVCDFFADFVAAGGFYKAVADDGTMMAVARTYPVAEGYAYLGSARTGIPYRGQGLATALARFLIDDVRQRGFAWVGLATDETNVAVHRSMDKVGLRLLGTKAYVVAKAGQLASFLKANGIDLPAGGNGREVADRGEKIALLRGMLTDARAERHGDAQVRLLSTEPFVILPPNDDFVPLMVDRFRIRLVGGHPYLLNQGMSEGWPWTEGTFFGGNIMQHADILADMCAVAPPDREYWLLMSPTALAGVDRTKCGWSGVLRLYGTELSTGGMGER